MERLDPTRSPIATKHVFFTSKCLDSYLELERQTVTIILIIIIIFIINVGSAPHNNLPRGILLGARRII